MGTDLSKIKWVDPIEEEERAAEARETFLSIGLPLLFAAFMLAINGMGS